MSPELWCEPYKVSTLIGESIVPKRVYRNYVVFILHKVLPCDFVELDMVDFDVILGMDWLHAYYGSTIVEPIRSSFNSQINPSLSGKVMMWW